MASIRLTKDVQRLLRKLEKLERDSRREDNGDVIGAIYAGP